MTSTINDLDLSICGSIGLKTMKHHIYYTEIPQRSFEAIVKNDWISEILLAMIVDPLSAEDVADSLKRDAQRKSLVIDPMTSHAKPYRAPVSPSEIADLGSNMLSSWRITMSQWVNSFTSAQHAFWHLVPYDGRLGVWAACNVAKTVLPFVSKGNRAPSLAIKAAEGWLLGSVSADDVRKAAVRAERGKYSSAADSAAAASAASAARVACSYDYQAKHAADSAAFAADAYAAPYAILDQNSIRDRYGEYLLKVISESCMTFPLRVAR